MILHIYGYISYNRNNLLKSYLSVSSLFISLALIAMILISIYQSSIGGSITEIEQQINYSELKLNYIENIYRENNELTKIKPNYYVQVYEGQIIEPNYIERKLVTNKLINETRVSLENAKRELEEARKDYSNKINSYNVVAKLYYVPVYLLIIYFSIIIILKVSLISPKGVLGSIGVVCFILGNILQLYATFQ